MDNLTIDAMSARKHGVSYGKYMASKIIQKAEPPKEPEPTGKFKRECPICGASFVTNRSNKITCSFKCSEQRNRNKAYENYCKERDSRAKAMGK